MEDDKIRAEERPSSSRYRLVALDLDGTLLNSEHKLTEATKECLRHLDQHGFQVIIATGRAIPTVYETIASLNLPRPIPVVCSNGAQGVLCSAIDDGKGGFVVKKEQLFTTPVPQGVAKRTIELSNALGCVTQYYQGESIYANPRESYHFELTGMYQELTGCKTVYVNDNFQEALKEGLPSKQLVLCKKEEQDATIDAFETELAKKEYQVNGMGPTIVRGNLGWFLEILPPNVCKGNGLKKMCEYLKVPLSECIAFGDGDNDYEFLQLAGRGYAMSNARDVVKGIADEVLEYSNDEDGVAKTLQQLEARGCLMMDLRN